MPLWLFGNKNPNSSRILLTLTVLQNSIPLGLQSTWSQIPRTPCFILSLQAQLSFRQVKKRYQVAHVTSCFNYVKKPPALCLVAVFIPITSKVLRRSQITKNTLFPITSLLYHDRKKSKVPDYWNPHLLQGNTLFLFLHQNTSDLKVCHTGV